MIAPVIFGLKTNLAPDRFCSLLSLARLISLKKHNGGGRGGEEKEGTRREEKREDNEANEEQKEAKPIGAKD